MNLEIELPVEGVFVEADISREGAAFYIRNIHVYAMLFGREVRMELSQSVMHFVERRLIAAFEKEEEFDGAEKWNLTLDR